MTWLVTGGAGYIGAHVVRALLGSGERVVVLDDLSTGERDRVDPAAGFEQGSLLDRGLVRRVLREHEVTGVVHIAAKKQVGESMADPLLYYRENVEGLIALAESCQAKGVDRFVFSSSAATYGLPDVELVDESTPGVPLSPYGESKLIGEWLLRHCERAYGLRTMNMRYFNVAGAATPELGDTGVFNLIPMVFERLQQGARPRVFGNDYDTPDGTCVRDYVHVADIADAHLVAAQALDSGSAGATYNIGRGEGSSVLDVLAVVGEVTGLDSTPEVVERRPGDPARIVASVGKIREELGFTAQHDLRSMVESAWAGWQLRHP
jgi:UDP-glucose 4-epimerase